MVPDALGRVPIGNPPEVLSCVHVDGRDPSVGGLVDRKSLRAPEVPTIKNGILRERRTRGHDVVGLIDIAAGDEPFGSASLVRGHVENPGFRVRRNFVLGCGYF